MIDDLTLTRRAVDDQEMKAFLKLDQDMINDFGTGTLEDVFPYFKDIFPTAKWKKLKSTVEEFNAILRAKFRKHVDTFEIGNLKTYVKKFVDELLKTCRN
jgi:hypothetical protein